MKKIYNNLISSLKYFNYFYEIVKSKLVISLFTSILLSLLDGVGIGLALTMVQSAIQSKNTTENIIFLKINSLLRQGGFENIQFKTLIIFTIVIFVFKAIIYYLHLNLQVVINNKIINETRMSLVNKLSQLSYIGFLKLDIGTFQNISTNEVTRLNSAAVTLLNSTQYLIMGLTYIALATISNYEFSIIVMFSLILTSLIFKTIIKKTKHLSRLVSSRGNIFSSYISQILNNYKYLKATNVIAKYNTKLNEEIQESSEINYRLSKLNAFTLSIREPVILLLGVAIVYSYSLLNGNLTTAIILPILLLYKTINYILLSQSNWQNFNQYSGSINNIFAELRQLDINKELLSTNPLKAFNNTIVLKNISFSYETKKVLNNINLKIDKNKTLAIVGKSGSGKTTLAALINGLFNPTSGDIFVDNNKLDSYNIETYRSKIGYVSQDPVIFNDTFYNNITLWAEKTIENIEMFKKVIKLTNLVDLITESNNLEETILGDNGKILSGGQKQRVSIARELFKNVEIIILDEATSSLDTILENEIQINLLSTGKQVTFIIIAHRLSTIKNADSIILLDKGNIVREGTFNELYNYSTEFKEMVDIQKI